MKVYLVFKHLDIDNNKVIDLKNIEIFENKRDAFAYAYALRSHKHFNEVYETIEVMTKEII